MLNKFELMQIANTIQLSVKTNRAHGCYRLCIEINKNNLTLKYKNKLKRLVLDSLLISDFENNDIFKNLYNNHGIFSDSFLACGLKFYINRRIPSISYITRELEIIQSEYSDINLTADGNIFSAVTPNIILKDVEFGRFRIKLELNNLGIYSHLQQFEAEALDPNSPEGTNVTHPHVKGGIVCTGNGTNDLTKALKDIRIIDYLDIHKSILNTLGLDPFLSILAWTGKKCRDCSYYYSDDDNDNYLYYKSICEKCDEEYCNNCVREWCCGKEKLCVRCRPPLWDCRSCCRSLCKDCVEVCENNISRDCNRVYCGPKHENCTRYHKRECSMIS